MKFFTKIYGEKLENYINDNHIAKSLDFVCQILASLLVVFSLGATVFLFRVAPNEIGMIPIYICASIMVLVTIAFLINYSIKWVTNFCFYIWVTQTTTSKKFNKTIFILNIISFFVMIAEVIVTLIIFLR